MLPQKLDSILRPSLVIEAREFNELMIFTSANVFSSRIRGRELVVSAASCENARDDDTNADQTARRQKQNGA